MLLFFRLVAGAKESLTLAFAAVDAKGQELLPGSFLRAVRGLFAANAIHMPLVEEPQLRERFGADYERYAANVPRWRPRLRPWSPG